MMKFSVKRAELVAELALLRGAVESKTTIPILTNLRLDAGPAGLRIAATDLDVSLQTNIEAESMAAAGSVAIPAALFAEYVKLLDGDQVAFEEKANHWVHLRCGDAKAKLGGMDAKNFPSLPEFPKGQPRCSLHAEMLRKLIGCTSFAISSEESRYTLNGALATVAGGSVRMVATDGHRLAMCAKDGAALDGASFEAIIPAKALRLLAKLIDATDAERVEVAGDDSSLYFQVGKRLLVSRKLAGKFPDYNAVLPAKSDKAVILGAAEFERSIRRAAQFSDERSGAVVLTLDGHDFRVRASSMTGEAEDRVEGEVQGGNLVIGFNYGYLLEFLKVCDGKVRVELTTADKGALLMPAQSDGYELKYVVMPMRV